MARYICRRRLNHDDGWLEPGQEFVVKHYHNWKPLLAMGWIVEVADDVSIPARPAAALKMAEIPSNLNNLKKAELYDVLEGFGIEGVEGTGSGGLVTKADLIMAIKSYGDH